MQEPAAQAPIHAGAMKLYESEPEKVDFGSILRTWALTCRYKFTPDGMWHSDPFAALLGDKLTGN